MEIHHGKHHQTYITNLNNALDGQDQLLSMQIEDLISDLSSLPDAVQGAVRNNGGGHANHSFFWESLSASGGGLPSGALADAISSTFGNFDALKENFCQSCFNTIWFRMGLADSKGGWNLGRHLYAQSGLAHHGRNCRRMWHSTYWTRCLGACLLFKLPKQTPRLCGRILECFRLGSSIFSI